MLQNALRLPTFHDEDIGDNLTNDAASVQHGT